MSLPDSLARFAQLLRLAGVPAGTDRVLQGVQALQVIGLERRDDVRTGLRSIFVSRHEHYPTFDAAFDLFWRPPARAGLPGIADPDEPVPTPDKPRDPAAERVAAALAALMGRSPVRLRDPDEDEPEEDARGTASDREQLRRADFRTLSPDSLAEIQKRIAQLHLTLKPQPTRRQRPDPRGRSVDLRATLRASLRSGGDAIPLCRRAPRRRPPPLVVLCDVSGSMQPYAPVLLRFIHTLARDLDRCHAFVFGTRLTDITRKLAHRDVDIALQSVAGVVQDYAGGTRIGPSLQTFNRLWARRVLGQNATVLLISDGLERDDPSTLAIEAARLKRSCRRLLWLNPLLRFQAFEPVAGGIRALLPQADGFLPVHNLASLEKLAALLGRQSSSSPRSPRSWT